MKAPWHSLIQQLEDNPSLLMDLFPGHLQPSDAFLLEALEDLLQQSVDRKLTSALHGDVELMKEEGDRRALLGNLEAQCNIRLLLEGWGGNHLN